jgi:hypothetical protein
MRSDTVPMKSPEEMSGMEYTIRVKGCLNELDWSGWFGNMNVLLDENRCETILKGVIGDSAELYGLISKLRNLGLVLISIEPSD